MAIDTSKTMEIRVSRWKVLAVLVGALVLAGGSAAMAIDQMNSANSSTYREFVGIGGVLFFGFGFFAQLVAAYKWRGPVVTLSPEGIRDIRMSHELVPWSAVHDITTLSGTDPKMQEAIASYMPVRTRASDRQINKLRFVILSVDPGIKAQLVASRRLGKWAMTLDKAYGVDGIAINPQQLSVNFDTLLGAVKAYWQAAKGAATG